ncbi:hypothetical protein K440DRAFT_194975 [Wilcoxina mikolae CBS 423.85]|nr:hypothetical protein K440DRAFT_194975 [Wilcoxina mikolae CBS 423.85]
MRRCGALRVLSTHSSSSSAYVLTMAIIRLILFGGVPHEIRPRRHLDLSATFLSLSIRRPSLVKARCVVNVKSFDSTTSIRLRPFDGLDRSPRLSLQPSIRRHGLYSTVSPFDDLHYVICLSPGGVALRRCVGYGEGDSCTMFLLYWGAVKMVLELGFFLMYLGAVWESFSGTGARWPCVLSSSLLPSTS